MAATPVQTAHASAAGTSVTLAAAPTSGNVLVATVANSLAVPPAAATGWTAIGAGVGAGSGTSRRSLTCMYHVCGSSESTTQTPTTTGTSNLSITEWSGLDTSGSLVDGVTYTATAAGATQTTGSITPTASTDRLIIAAYTNRGFGGDNAIFSNETIGGVAAIEADDTPIFGNMLVAVTYLEVTSTSGSYSGTATSADTTVVGANGIFALIVAAAAGPTETNLSRIGLEATGLTVKAAVGSALRGSAGFGATCTALKITTGTSRAQSGLRASAIAAKMITATARAQAGVEAKAIAAKSMAGTGRAQAGLEVADTAVKAGIGTARAQAGVDATDTEAKTGIATATASAGVEAASTESKIGSGTGRATVGIESTANAAKSVSGTARADAGLESTATASRTAAATATAQGQLGLDASSTAVKAGLATAQAEAGLESAGTAQKVGLGTAQAEAGAEATATASKTVVATANATAQGSAGLEATAQASKSTAGTGRASIGAESIGEAAKIGSATGQASVGSEAVSQGSKHGAAQAVASVGAQGQCASGIKSSTAIARGSVGLRARSVTTLPTPAGAAPKMIWVDGRLALRVSQVVYERL